MAHTRGQDLHRDRDLGRGGGIVDVWTIGHSTRELDELVALLLEHGIEVLVDVRTVPRSRYNPQFNRESLAAVSLPFDYRHEPGLGGLRRPRPDSHNTGWRNHSFRGFADYMETAAFEAALEALIEEAQRQRVAVMCAEAVPWRCHRSLVADALIARGACVWHITGAGQCSEHRITPFATVRDGRVGYPGEGRPPG